MSEPVNPPPDLLEEIVAILTDDATYDEPIQARVHMVQNVLRGTDLGFEDAVVATALSMSTPLGLLAGDARQRIRAICDAAGLSITTIEAQGGFITDVDELITVAAYQAARSDLLPQEIEQRLLYLYGGASEDLDLDVDPEEFKDRVSERAASDPPGHVDLPARAAAAEIKQQSGLSQGNAREAVRHLLALDPAEPPERSADAEVGTEAEAEADPAPAEPVSKPFDAAVPATGHGAAADIDSDDEDDTSEPEPVDPDLVEIWGCPFCHSTNVSLRSIKAHITGASRPPHKGVNGHKPSHHIPGYDDSGVLITAYEQWVEGESSAVLPAPTVGAEGWYTEAQAAAARADVPIQTQHTEDTVEQAPETDEILSTVATVPADHSPGDQASDSGAEEDQAGAGDHTPTRDQEGSDPGVTPGETTPPTADPAGETDPTPVATADPVEGEDPPESTPSSANTASASSADAAGSTPAWTPVPEDADHPKTNDEPVAPIQSSTEPRTGADEIPSTFLPDDTPTRAGVDQPTADPSEQEAETSEPAPDSPADSSGPSDEESTEQDDAEGARVLEAPGLRIADGDDADGEDTVDIKIISLDDREAVLETALAIHHHERIPNGEKPDLLATLVEDATVDVDPQTVREHLADAPAHDDRRPHTQSRPASGAAGSPESGSADAEDRRDDTLELGSDWTVEVRENRLQTPVGTVSTQGELADAAVRVYRSSLTPADQCPAIVRAMAQRAGEIGITVTADDLFEMLALRLDQDPRAQTASGADDQPLTADAVHDRAATILRDDTLSTDEKIDRIQNIVSQATEQGIEVSLEEVLAKAKARRQDSDGGN